MKIYSENEYYKLYQGSMLDMLEVINKESIDSIITDPPYELNFMNKGWDNSGIAFQKETWKKCYEVLKPGGYLLAFGGSRTFHRIAVAIEDAGFEIRDTIMWLYGSGFPKSMNIGLAIDKKNGIDNRTGNIKTDGKATDSNSGCYNINNGKSNMKQEYEERIAQNEWQGWGTALKPSFEPIIVARKPFKGSLVDNVIEYGVGGINIDECRVEMQEQDKEEYYKKQKSFENTYRTMNIYGGNALNKSTTTFYDLETYTKNTLNKGRFPANTILTYDETVFDEVCGGFPDTKGSSNPRKNTNGNVYGDYKTVTTQNDAWGDSGSASRYFYCAKASKKDRDIGLKHFEKQKVNDGRQKEVDNAFQRGETLRKNIHPTVKPCELMQYLVRLVSPKGSTILDCFNGSGSTGKAVMYENIERDANYKYIGIELTEEYLPIAKARIEYISNENLPVEDDSIIEGQTNIFDFIGE